LNKGDNVIYLKIVSLIVVIWFSVSSITNVWRGWGFPWQQLLITATAWAIFIFSMGWLG